MQGREGCFWGGVLPGKVSAYRLRRAVAGLAAATTWAPRHVRALAVAAVHPGWPAEEGQRWMGPAK